MHKETLMKSKKIKQGKPKFEYVCPICGNPSYKKSKFCPFCKTEIKKGEIVEQKKISQE